jgi:hypothetical protein
MGGARAGIFHFYVMYILYDCAYCFFAFALRVSCCPHFMSSAIPEATNFSSAYHCPTKLPSLCSALKERSPTLPHIIPKTSASRQKARFRKVSLRPFHLPCIAHTHSHQREQKGEIIRIPLFYSNESTLSDTSCSM